MPSHVTVYSAPLCGGCQHLKSALKEEGIEFNEIDIRAISEDQIVDLHVALGVTGHPVKVGQLSAPCLAVTHSDGSVECLPSHAILGDDGLPHREIIEAVKIILRGNS